VRPFGSGWGAPDRQCAGSVYEYRQWRRAVLLSYCVRASEGELCARRKGVQEWQARGYARRQSGLAECE
jgi:hypothetical protein